MGSVHSVRIHPDLPQGVNLIENKHGFVWNSSWYKIFDVSLVSFCCAVLREWHECMAKSKAIDAIDFSPPDKSSMGKNLKIYIRQTFDDRQYIYIYICIYSLLYLHKIYYGHMYK